MLVFGLVGDGWRNRGLGMFGNNDAVEASDQTCELEVGQNNRLFTSDNGNSSLMDGYIECVGLGSASCL